MTTNETTDPTAWRPAYEGERCDCGQPASTVFVTERWGDVPYCGVPHAGDHPGEMLDERPSTTCRAGTTVARLGDLQAVVRAQR